MIKSSEKVTGDSPDVILDTEHEKTLKEIAKTKQLYDHGKIFDVKNFRFIF